MEKNEKLNWLDYNNYSAYKIHIRALQIARNKGIETAWIFTKLRRGGVIQYHEDIIQQLKEEGYIHAKAKEDISDIEGR